MSLSRNPVISKHPTIARIMQTIFLDVIFSLKRTYAKIRTKMGAVDSRVAARDNGTVFIDSL